MENIKNSIPCRTDGSVHGSKDPQDSYGRSFSGWKVRTRAEHHRLHYGSRSRLCSFCAAVPGGCKEIFKTSSCSDDQRQQSAQEQSPGCKRERLNQYSAAEVIPRRNANHHRIKQCQRTGFYSCAIHPRRRERSLGYIGRQRRRSVGSCGSSASDILQCQGCRGLNANHQRIFKHRGEFLPRNSGTLVPSVSSLRRVF